MDMNVQAKPRMPPIENFADTGPVGVLNPCCTTRTGRIRAAGASDADWGGGFARLCRTRCGPVWLVERRREGLNTVYRELGRPLRLRCGVSTRLDGGKAG